MLIDAARALHVSGARSPNHVWCADRMIARTARSGTRIRDPRSAPAIGAIAASDRSGWYLDRPLVAGPA
jgi:hypothetical protein